jgi:hypothetical protein
MTSQPQSAIAPTKRPARRSVLPVGSLPSFMPTHSWQYWNRINEPLAWLNLAKYPGRTSIYENLLGLTRRVVSLRFRHLVIMWWTPKTGPLEMLN